jgi:hypothetical protein
MGAGPTVFAGSFHSPSCIRSARRRSTGHPASSSGPPCIEGRGQQVNRSTGQPDRGQASTTHRRRDFTLPESPGPSMPSGVGAGSGPAPRVPRSPLRYRGEPPGEARVQLGSLCEPTNTAGPAPVGLGRVGCVPGVYSEASAASQRIRERAQRANYPRPKRAMAASTRSGSSASPPSERRVSSIWTCEVPALASSS